MSGTTLSTLQTHLVSVLTTTTAPKALLSSPFHRWGHWHTKSCSNHCKVVCCNESCLSTRPPGLAAPSRPSAHGESPASPDGTRPRCSVTLLRGITDGCLPPERRHKAWPRPFLHSTMCLRGLHFFKLFTWRQWRWDGWATSPMQWTWTWANSGRWRGTGRSACCGPWVARSRTRLGDRTATVISHAAAVRNSKSSCVASPEHPQRSRCDTDTGPSLTRTLLLPLQPQHSPPVPQHRLLTPGDLQPALYFCNSAASTALHEWSRVVHAFGDGSTRHPAGLCRAVRGWGLSAVRPSLWRSRAPWHTHHVCLFSHSPVEEHLALFQVWAITNKATINTHVQISLWT